MKTTVIFNALKSAALALPFLVGAVLPASAGTISNVQMGNSEGITVSGGILGGSGRSVDAGQILLTTGSGSGTTTLGVWCVDLLHVIYMGQKYNYTLSPLTTDNANGYDNHASTALTSSTVKEIAALAGFGNAVLGHTLFGAGDYATDLATLSAKLATVQTDPSYEKKITTTTTTVWKNGKPHKSTKTTTTPIYDMQELTSDLNAFAAAIQAVIWHVEYGVTATGSAQFNEDYKIIENDLNQIETSFYNVGGEQMDVTPVKGSSPLVQQQFLTEVPEPMTLAVMMAGFLGFGALRRRNA